MISRNSHVAAALLSVLSFVFAPFAQARFLQTDPVGYADQMNAYTYVNNDPTNATDPSGNEAIAWGLAAWQFQNPNATPEEVARAHETNAMGATAGAAGAGVLFVGGAAILAPAAAASAGLFGAEVLAGDALGGASITATAAVIASRADDIGGALKQLQGFADNALANVGPGKGALHGTAVHSDFASQIKSLQNPNLHSEASYLNGQVATYGTPGSVRVDAAIGSKGAPSAAVDLKTGGATLTQSRIQELRQHLPASCTTIACVKPGN